MEHTYLMREFTDDMAKELKGIKILRGSHEGKENRHNQACIMEAISVITDQPFTDYPVCVSEAIIETMIKLNDATTTSDEQREMLKRAVPYIIGTAPVYLVRERVHTPNKGTEMVWVPARDRLNEQYVDAEEERLCILDDNFDVVHGPRVPMINKLAIIAQMADIRRTFTWPEELRCS